jgi:hypothetical protein
MPHTNSFALGELHYKALLVGGRVNSCPGHAAETTRCTTSYPYVLLLCVAVQELQAVMA